MSYTVHKELRFEVCGEEFAITSLSDFRAVVEETRKNGQEDTHMAGELVKDADGWRWSADWGCEQFKMYGNDGVVDAIPAYLNAHPLPTDF